MFSAQKYFPLPILIMISLSFNSCCLEQWASFNWDIVNNSADTIFITKASLPFPDSIAILPYQTFTQDDGDLGRHKTFYCARNFENSEVTVSGGKMLLKNLDNNENWIQNSNYTACKGEHRCSFTIKDVDIN